MYNSIIIAFILGGIISAVFTSLIFIIKNIKEKNEYMVLKAKLNSEENLFNLIQNQFVSLARETIINEQEDLRKQNREALEEKLSPLSKNLSEFKDKIEKFNISGIENTTKIVEQIGMLQQNNSIIEKETRNLVEALSKNRNVKGFYGENLLEIVIQSVGMVENIHYKKQYTSISENLKDNEIHNIRPDFVINLPENKHLVIDSKVTLTSYLDFVENGDNENIFKSEIKKRITELSQKNYQNALGINSLEFVLMYIPIEAIVNYLYQDTEIIDTANKSNVIIVGTSSLIVALRLINSIIAQQKQLESVDSIIKAGTNLYETFVQFSEDLLEVQKRFGDVNKILTTTINRFSRDNKNRPSLFSQVENLKQYGIYSQKSIPKELISSDEQ